MSAAEQELATAKRAIVDLLRRGPATARDVAEAVYRAIGWDGYDLKADTGVPVRAVRALQDEGLIAIDFKTPLPGPFASGHGCKQIPRECSSQKFVLRGAA